MRWAICLASGIALWLMAQAANATGTPPVSGPTDAITWSPTVLRLTKGCDSWSPTPAPDGNLYVLYGDCTGLSKKLKPKRSTGLGRISGSPAIGTVKVADIDTGAKGAPDIDRTDTGGGVDALGNNYTGKKPSSLMALNGALYAWIRNVGPQGTQSRIRYTVGNFTRPGSIWSWAPWTLTEFGYPSFVHTGQTVADGASYVYIVSCDGPSSYTPSDQFILMRVPAAQLLNQSAYEFFSGTADTPAWVSFDARAARTAIFTNPGHSLRSAITYNAARDRYYWWQEIPPPPGVDVRVTGGFGVYSAPQPWGPWTTVFYTDQWDVGPGEKGEFPSSWMSADGIAAPGTMYLIFSGNDWLAIRAGTIAAGY